MACPSVCGCPFLRAFFADKLPDFTIIDSSIAHRIIKSRYCSSVREYPIYPFQELPDASILASTFSLLSKCMSFLTLPSLTENSLDITPYSPHVKRRIWQESISTLLLATEDCRIPASQKMEYAYSTDSQWPPYLLEFQGTPGERHAENLKVGHHSIITHVYSPTQVLREVGWLAYARGISLTTGPERERLEDVQSIIQKSFVGPDCFWQGKLSGKETPSGRGKFFGNAWWTPFPPTLVRSSPTLHGLFLTVYRPSDMTTGASR